MTVLSRKAASLQLKSPPTVNNHWSLIREPIVIGIPKLPGCDKVLISFTRLYWV